MSTKLRFYRGEDIEVSYDVKRCIHAAECGRGLPAVFDAKKRPWVQPDEAEADVVADVVSRCPSGALYFTRRDGGLAETPAGTNTVINTLNGPLYISGDVTIQSFSGDVLHTEMRAALCRCGASENKPFCDNSHQGINFEADGGVAGNGVEGVVPAGALTIIPAPNGPLLLNGNFEIHSQDGTAIYRGQRAALCRCGGSANKPFCDGTHKDNGFIAD